MKKVLLSIAGFDPTSGAGVLLDIRTFQRMGFYGTGVVTALTTQNTKHVSDTFTPPPKFIEKQYRTLRDDIEISGIKVGMLGGRQNIPEIDRILSENPKIPKIVDPIIRSSSGYWFLDKDDVSAYKERIGPKASLLTPNKHEAILLAGMDIRDIDEMKDAAEKIFRAIMTPCLLKGGHFKQSSTDVLFDGKEHTLFTNEKIEKDVHGTGCFLSSSLLGYLVSGHSLRKACEMAIYDTIKAIKNAVPIGHGQHIIQFDQ